MSIRIVETEEASTRHAVLGTTVRVYTLDLKRRLHLLCLNILQKRIYYQSMTKKLKWSVPITSNRSEQEQVFSTRAVDWLLRSPACVWCVATQTNETNIWEKIYPTDGSNLCNFETKSRVCGWTNAKTEPRNVVKWRSMCEAHRRRRRRRRRRCHKQAMTNNISYGSDILA